MAATAPIITSDSATGMSWGLQIGDGTANIMKMIIGREKIAEFRL